MPLKDPTARREYDKRHKATKRYREAHAARQRQWYYNHPNYQAVLAAKDAPCVDCGVRLIPPIMELDHVRGRKQVGLSQGLVTRSTVTLAAVKREIAKCEVRCPNCHRLRHYNGQPFRKVI